MARRIRWFSDQEHLAACLRAKGARGIGIRKLRELRLQLGSFRLKKLIDIGSHRDNWGSAIGRLDHLCNDPALPGRNSMRNPGCGELFAEIIGCREFLAAELRVPMEVTPDLREAGDSACELRLNSA